MSSYAHSAKRQPTTRNVIPVHLQTQMGDREFVSPLMLSFFWRWIVTLLLAVLFGCTSLLLLGDNLASNIHLMRYLAVAGVLVILSMLGATDWRYMQLRQGGATLFCWCLFSLALLYTAVYRHTVKDVVEAVWMLSAVPVLFFIVVPNLIAGYECRVMGSAMVLGHLPYAAYSLATCPVQFGSSYQGAFENPASMGLLGSSMGVGALVSLLGCLHEQRILQLRTVISCGMLLLSTGLVLLSGSRTNLLAMGVMFFLGIILIQTKTRKVSFAKVMIGVAVVIACGVTLMLDSENLILEALYNKLMRSADSADQLNGRGDLWMYGLSNMTMTGLGGDFFYNEFGFGAHNTFISVLVECGMLPAVPFALFIVISLIRAFQLTRIRTINPSKTTAMFIVAAGFWILSIMEVMLGSLGKGFTLAYFIAVGMMLQQTPVSRRVTRAAFVAQVGQKMPQRPGTGRRVA